MLSKQVKARIKARKLRRRHPKKRQLELMRRRMEAGVLKLQRNVVVGAYALPSGEFNHDRIRESIKKSTALREQYRAADIRYYGRDRISKRYATPKMARKLQQRDHAQFGLAVL